MYEYIEPIDQEVREIIPVDNEEYISVYKELISDILKNTDFKKIHVIHRGMEIKWKSINDVPSAKQIQSTAHDLMNECLDNMLKNGVENYSLNKENIFVEIYGLNYPDPEFAGYVNLSYRLENTFKYFKDIMIFEEHITEKSEMSLDERLYIIEDKLRKLEKKVGIKNIEK